ncbi:MAG: hypothetical protein JWL80_157 [Parcubacteria group bacterium]|nr:hypothetical protein [Parcubacteria group bacterium]
MKDIIVISGAPGSGKSTVAKILQEKLQSPLINLGWIRQWHLKRDWSDATFKEEEMSFEILVQALHKYIENGYKNILVEDLEDEKVQRIPSVLEGINYIIVSLTIDSDEELKQRVLGERDSGFKDWERAVKWNKDLKERTTLPHEYKIDNSHNNPETTAAKILEIMSL